MSNDCRFEIKSEENERLDAMDRIEARVKWDGWIE